MNVSTLGAANLYGCSRRHLTLVMREAGVEPEVRMASNKHGGTHREYYWDPSDVMRVRAERKVRQLEAKALFVLRSKAGLNRHRSSTLARATRNENFRQKLLKRIAERQTQRAQ
jgi:hypothetical protein